MLTIERFLRGLQHLAAAFTLLSVSSACVLGQMAAVRTALAEGEKAKAAGKWALGVAAFQRARAAAVQLGDAALEAEALAGSGHCEMGRDRLDEAMKLAELSLEIARRTGNRRGEAAAIKLVSQVHYRRSDFHRNLSALQQYLALQRELGDEAGIAIAYNNIGNTLRVIGDKTGGLEHLIEAERRFETLGNDRSRGVVLNNIGTIYIELGDYDRALEFCHKSLALAGKFEDNFEFTGAALARIALAEGYRGNYRQSLQFHRRAIEQHRRSGSVWGVAEEYNNIALVYQAQGNHELAAENFRRTIASGRALQDKGLMSEGHNNLGMELLALGRPAEAAAEFRNGIAISVRIATPGLQAECRRGLGAALTRMNRYAEAAAELSRAATAQRSIPDFPNLAQTLIALSQLRLKENRPEEALAEAAKAHEVLATIDLPEVLWQAHAATAAARMRLGQVDAAARSYEGAIEVIESLRTRVAGPATTLPTYLADKLEPYQQRTAIALTRGNVEEALRFAEQSRSRVLGDVLGSTRTDLDKALTADERRAERQLKNRLASLNLQLARHPADASLKQARDLARADLEAMQTAFDAAHPEAAFLRGVTPAMSGAAMAEVAARARAAILNYVATPRNTYVFLIRPGAAVKAVKLPLGQQALAPKAAEFHRQLASHDLGYAELAQEMYRLLVKPIEADLAGQTALVILPDGPLWDVPFHALQSKPGHFLIEDFAISYAPSMRVLDQTMKLAMKRGSASAPRGLLALGNPAGQPPLPEAERQVREIGRLYGPESLILSGEAASRARLRAEAAGYRVVHLASHAILDGENPMYSHALLARSPNDPGTLEARELMEYDLQAGLLVLSACDTARGRAVGGEGINGLVWAAFVAGAPTTVASLWRVEAASTSDLMVHFHRNRLDAVKRREPGATPNALRKAALGLLAGGRYSHPFYWAGFVTMGSPL
ncbi:MAG: CHAT domain-containing protein [Bryobacterales bacterium]|nr:CHAT domain-containing protein [Bryobacterales bacterium]